ncbi:MAG: serine hydrolase, partial [Anaerolinea sp.]|nr:serine hydrolase [Anaerolinea sp.]
YAGVASGRAWVFADLVILEGDINLVPLITEMNFGYPTLTPTPNKVVSGVSPFGSAPVSLSTPLDALGKNLYDYLMAQGFEPGTNTQGSLFLLNLKTGEAVSLNPGIAYSGVSLMKIPVLVSFFRKVNTIPDATQAQLMAEMIACSENISSNKLLATLGDGDEYRGTQYVTETMRTLGLKNTFLARSFYDGVVRTGATEQPFMPPTIEADQVQTNPDPSNQTTPEDMGWLLSGMYQCALNGDGPLVSAFPNQIDQNDCRRMIRVLRTNHIGALIEAGVPSGVTVAHKHGWADASHGDAGIVFTSGGDYVLSVMLASSGTWLLQEITFPTIAEISRQTYNLFNPSAPLASTHTQPVPAVCTIDTINALDPRYLTDMQNPNPPAIR